MLSSIREGIAALGGAAELARRGAILLVSPADLPNLRAETVAELLRRMRESGAPLAVPVYHGQRGHPLAIAPALIPEIDTLDPNVGLQQLRDRHAAELLEVRGRGCRGGAGRRYAGGLRAAGWRPDSRMSLGSPSHRHRPPRRQRLPARAHAGVLRAGDRDGRRFHRARPGLDEGRRPDRPPRERDLGDHRRRRPSGIRGAARRPSGSTAARSPAGSPRTSRFAEIKTLRARERLPFRDQSFNGRFEVPTFAEVLDAARRKSAGDGRTIGVYPETKHPELLPLARPAAGGAAAARLETAGYSGRTAPVFIQSFEVGNLQELRNIDRSSAHPAPRAHGQPWDFAVAGDATDLSGSRDSRGPRRDRRLRRRHRARTSG